MVLSTTFRSNEIGKTGQMEEELTGLIKSGRLDGKEIFAMGNLIFVAEMDVILKKNNKIVEAIVDNDPTKAGKKECGGEAYSIITVGDFVKRKNEKTAIIIFSIRFWREMADQMMSLGFVENVDLFVLEALTLEKKIGYVKRGAELYSRLCDKYGETIFPVIFYGPIGDNYFFSLFLKEYLKKNNILSAVFLGDKTAEKIINLFSFSPYEEINRDELLAMEFFYMFSDKAESRLKILQVWEFCFHFNRSRIRFDRRFSFIDTYRHYIFGLEKGTRPCQPCFDANEERLSDLFLGLALQKGKTVILAPYAYSIDIHPKTDFWIELAKGLEQKGYSIAVNIDPEREENFIPSAKAISFGLNESVPVLEYAGVFIGMRSGFCDVISSAHCKKAALYPKVDLSVIDYDRHRNDMEFSSFSRMELSEDFYEFEFENRDETTYWTELASSILNSMFSEKV